MTTLSELHVLIVDVTGRDGSELCRIFGHTCARTDVAASYPIAYSLIESTKVDAVLLPFATDPDTIAFCKVLSQKGIACIFTSEPPPRYSKRRPMSDAIVAIHKVLAENPETVHKPGQPSLH